MDRLRKNVVDKLVSRRSEKDSELQFSNDSTTGFPFDTADDARISFARRATDSVVSHSYASTAPPDYEQVGLPVIEGQRVLRVNSDGGGLLPSQFSMNDPLGLARIHTCTEPFVDFIFVHGLGGTSITTWSWEKDPKNCWLPWLGNDVDLSRSRIFTYGYDASRTGSFTTVGFLDFAKDLLLRMKTYSGPTASDRIPIGTLPIVFVVHSMGGLVVKKAYILGRNDPQFTDMVSKICAMVFLATPHKGSHFAQTLNNILSVVPSLSSKAFVADLEKNSGALQDINEQFRHVYGDLQLVSFYETMKTNLLGPGVKKIIVDRESALLEYPGETSSCLMADHPGMARFKDPLDASYTNVTNVLRWLTRPIIGGPETRKDSFKPMPLLPVPSEEEPGLPSAPALDHEALLVKLGSILGIKSDYDDEFRLSSEKLHEGSCQWLLRKPSFQKWATNSSKPASHLWISGSPGSGKSTLASFIIQYLQNQSYSAASQHHFFLAADKDKKTLAYMLRSIAYQVALSSEPFLTRLIQLSEASAMTFEQEDVSTIWERIFEGVLFRLPSEDPLFWVIDGLDEAESPNEMLKLISRVRSAATINILIVSRATKDISKDIGDLLPSVVHERISAGDTAEDISGYDQGVGLVSLGEACLEKLKENWYTEDDIQRTLNEIPGGMEELYRRMIHNVAKQSEKDRDMATRILTWVACAFSPLDLAELEVALYPEFTGLVNLGVMAEEICGHFVTIKKSKVTLAHETALDFLLKNSTNLPVPISERQGHTHAASVCITFLSDSVKWRRIFNSAQPSQQPQRTESKNLVFEQNPFLSYALSQWAYHVSRATLESEDFLRSVLEFLEEYCLLWMHGVALTGRLRTLIRSAQYLKTFAKKRGQLNAKKPPRGLAVGLEDDLREWANDMIRIVGRFGGNMLENPACISTLVVPFCPRDSITAKTYGLSLQGGPLVKGVSSSGWDDCLARLNLGDNRLAAQVLCKDKYLVTLVANGGVVGLWHSETFEELRKIKHGDYVTSMTISWTSNIIATAGFSSTKVWDMTNGNLLNTLPNDHHHRPKTVSFGVDDDELWVAYDDCEIKCFNLETNEEKKGFLARDPVSQDLSCARWLRFNRANTQVAIVFRGRPVLVWNIQESLEQPPVPRRCVLADDRLRSAIEGDAWNSPELCFWHPTQLDHLFVLYEDTRIVEWDVVNDEQTVYDHTLARTMTISKDGNMLLTSDMDGTLSIWALPGCSLVYRARYDGLVTDLSFSPDGTRFYDLRGSFCNAWEPDALIRADNLDRDDVSSTLDATITSEAILANDDNSRVPVTALVCDSSDRYYCVGKEDGSVTIHNIADGTRSRKVVSHATSCSVIKLAWSASDKYLASVDDSGRIIVKRLEPPGTTTGNGSGGRDKWAVFPVLDIRMEDDAVVRQVLFGNRDGSLLITSASYVALFSLKQKREVCRKEYDSEGRTWFNHPRDPTLLVRLGAHTQQQYFWKDLSPVHGGSGGAGAGEATTKLADDAPQVLPRVIQQRVQVRNQWVLVELTARSPDGNTAELYPQQQQQQWSAREFELLNLHKLPGLSSATRSTTTNMRQTLHGLARHVKQLVGCFQDRVVFLDHQYWLCTWELELAYSKHKRHFFLPKDWVSPTALQMLALNRKGVLLCPRNGEVAIVRSGFR